VDNHATANDDDAHVEEIDYLHLATRDASEGSYNVVHPGARYALESDWPVSGKHERTSLFVVRSFEFFIVLETRAQ
jgi:hypothetical protein